MVRVPVGITCNMVPKVICAWLLVFVVATNGADEPKRDKRTVDILLRGAADLFGYDVIRRVSSPTLRQTAATPRPTFFPPPVASQLPTGTYSRVILALGQQQQQQQQDLQRRIEQAVQVPPLTSAQLTQQVATQPQQQQQAVINLPQNGALTASAESIHFPGGGLAPLFQVPSSAAQVSLLSALQAGPQSQVVSLAPIPPISVQRASLTAALQQQAAPVAANQQQQAAAQQSTPAAPTPQQAPPAQSAPQTQNGADGNNPSPFGIPLRLVAIAPSEAFGPNGQLQNAVQGQNAAQQAPASPQISANPSPSSAAATPADTAGSQPQTNGLSIVLDQGPTRWNLFNLPRQESIRRSLNLNLNWNRNVEPASPAQFQIVPVALQTTPTPPLQAQQVQSTQAPQQQQQSAQQQQLPSPPPTIENFEISVQPQNSNSEFNRYYNIPDNFQAKSAAQRQNDANVNFLDSVTRFWESSPRNENSGNSERASLREETSPRFEEYNSESNAEELNAPESEQLVEDNNEIITPSGDSNRREELNEESEDNKPRSRRFRHNSDRFDEETRESSDTPKFRRRNKIRRIRKVKKSVDDNGKSDAHKLYKREEKFLDGGDKANDDVKNFYKKFNTPISEEKQEIF